MRFPVIYSTFSCLNRFNSFNRYRASVAFKEKEKRSQKIDDFPTLATCWSGTLSMPSSEVNGPVA